jgi:hypothetical protein
MDTEILTGEEYTFSGDALRELLYKAVGAGWEYGQGMHNERHALLYAERKALDLVARVAPR